MPLVVVCTDSVDRSDGESGGGVHDDVDVVVRGGVLGLAREGGLCTRSPLPLLLREL